MMDGLKLLKVLKLVVIKKLGKKPTFNVDTIVTILEMGEAILDNISNKQIDQALSIIDNRDRLINILNEKNKK